MEFALPFPVPHRYRIEKWESVEVPEDFKKQVPEINSDKRLKEYFHGRILAQKTLFDFTGQNHLWLKRDAKGIPVWPKGTTGSISHQGGWAAVWVGPTGQSLGIDLQTWLSPSQAQRIQDAFLKKSLGLSHQVPGQDLSHQMTLVFCIFETIQKCLGNRGLGPIPITSIEWGEILEKSWSMKLKIGPNDSKIEGFWAGNDTFCVAFGSL